MVVLKEEIFNSFHIWRMWWSLKEVILKVSIFGGCGGPERSDF